MLQTDIQTIIEKSLPEQVGKVLKERLEQADTDSKELSLSKEQNSIDKKLILELQKEISSHQTLDIRESELNKKEKDLFDRENKLEQEKLALKLEEANKRADFATGFLNILAKNTTVKRGVFSNISSGGYYDQNGHWVSGGSHTNSETIIEEKE